MKYAEYMQQIEHLKIDMSELDSVLNSRPIQKWCYLVHDKDENEDGTLKTKHIHIMMAFRSDQTPETVAKWFNDEPQYIQKNKRPNKAYENMCSYLIHETESADGKYKYSVDEVKANFDFKSYLEGIREEVARAGTSKKRTHPIEDVLIKICDNEIPRIRLDEHLTNMEQIRYKRDIENAYEIRDRRKAREVNREMEVIYITGKAGTGKTTYAKILASEMDLSVFVSGSSNDPLQGYLGQECVILDDLRGSDWKMNDLLKLTDNNTNSLVKSRYSNKLLNDCKLMIITSVQDINELYESMSVKDEPIEQLKRRCKTLIRMTPKRVRLYTYSEEQRDHVFKKEDINPVPMFVFMAENSESMIDKITQITKAVQKKSEEKKLPW